MIQETKTTSTLRIIARWFVGLVFLFSSITKGIDPMGTAYKVVDYMTAWNFFGISFTGFTPLAPFLSMALITLEFLVGIMLITGSFRKLTAWVLLLMMTFFTFTTLYDAITNEVSDCGCFGDAVKLTNWQTFWKNVVLDVPTIFIFLTRRWPRKNKLERDTLIAIAAIAAMVIFGLYNINNEPVIDFRPWKVGNKMMNNLEEGLPTINYVTYKNNESGEQVTLTSTEFYNRYQATDSLWEQKWEWVSSRTISPYEIVDKDSNAISFPLTDAYEQDMTFDLIAATEGPVLMATIHNLDKVNERGVKAIAETKQLAMDRNIRFAVVAYVALTDEEMQSDEDLLALQEAKLQRFLYGNNLMDVEYYFGDEKAIEAMLRSNPGFILMENAVVKGKWHYRNAEKIQEYPFEEQ